MKLAQELYKQLKEATTKTGVTGAGYTQASENTLPIVAGRIINVVIAALALALLVYLVYGGYVYMTAKGDEDDVKRAQRIISESIIGLAIVMLAYAITRYVLGRLLKAVAGID